MAKPLLPEIVDGAKRHGMTATRRDKVQGAAQTVVDFTSDTTGKLVWASEDAAAARRFVKSCDINPSTIAHIVAGTL